MKGKKLTIAGQCPRGHRCVAAETHDRCHHASEQVVDPQTGEVLRESGICNALMQWKRVKSTPDLYRLQWETDDFFDKMAAAAVERHLTRALKETIDATGIVVKHYRDGKATFYRIEEIRKLIDKLLRSGCRDRPAD